ncbi:MAG: D-glycero-beta-D-manno-heptose 1,7-bisphosphate 7-phosphatase [Gammaproteobacteria bacterium]
MRLVILDRDGVINQESEAYIKSPDEWRPIPGSLEAIGQLHRAGFMVAVATNQAGVGRGLFTREALDKIHAKMQAAVEQVGGRLDAICVCPHRPEDHCSCRKPEPGLLLQIAARFAVGLGSVPVIGDSWRDVQAAVRVGARPILVRTGFGERAVARRMAGAGVEVFKDLAAASEQLLHEVRG